MAITSFLSLLRETLFILNIFFALVVVFYERRNPTSTWAWLMVIVIIPYFGFIIYLILGLDSRKRRVFAEKAKGDDALYKKSLGEPDEVDRFLNEQYSYIYDKKVFSEESSGHFNDMVYLNFVAGNGAVTTNEELSVYQSGTPKFEALLEDISKATDFIHIQYYILKDSHIGNKIISALTEAALRGVEVRLLVDGMGCAYIPKKFYKPLLNAGGELAVFLPPRLVRLNFRNHRKLVIIDGNLGYVGGINIGDEYLGHSKRFGHWRDCHIRVKGEAASQMNLRFIMDWNFASKKAAPPLSPPMLGNCLNSSRSVTLQDRTLESSNFLCNQRKLVLSERYLPANTVPEGDIRIQIVSSGPDTKWQSIQYAYHKMIAEANKTVYIQTPYFVPDDSVFEALRISALSGNDVRIVIPAHPDHPFVYWAGLSYLGELMSAGVKCYQYENGFLHSKLMIVDSLVSSVGTANMDVRSFKLNFETNAFIYHKDTAEYLTQKFLEDLRHCTELDLSWYAKRSAITKIREAVSRLLSPLL